MSKTAQQLDTPARYKDGRKFSTDARVYWLSEPLADSDRVIVSASMLPGYPETYIFPCDNHGTITGWCELKGSYRGGLDHAEALRGAGYEVVA